MGCECCYGLCNARSKSPKSSIKGAEGVFFIKFPDQKKNLEKCKRWVLACGRKNFTIENIKKSSYVCSRHFVGFQGPTLENPDPVPLCTILTEVDVTPECINTTPPKQIIKHRRSNSDSVNETPIVRKRFCPRELCLTPMYRPNTETLSPVNFNAASSKFNMSDIYPPKGWSLEVVDEGFIFTKHQNNFKVIEVIILTSVEDTSTCSLSVKVWEEFFNPETILPNVMIKSANDVYIFLGKFDDFTICPGNNDCDLVSLYKQSRNTPLYSTPKSYFCTKRESVYSRSCLRLYRKTNAHRCHECLKYRCQLRMMKLRSLKRSKDKGKGTKARIIVSKSKQNLSQSKENLRIIETMVRFCKERLKNEERGSFISVYLEQQIKAMTTSKHGMRWDPIFLKWCCYLKNKSKLTYDSLRRSRTMRLPTTRTLYNYMHTITSASGFHDEVFKQMAEETRVAMLPENQKYFMLLLDEMKVKENLVCHKNTGIVTGFSNLTKEHNELDDMERKITENSTPPLATQVLQLMLRGITSNIIIPFAHFPSKTASGAVLYSIIWEAIRRCENAGFRILGIVGDGATSNRKFFRMCYPSDSDEKGIPYFTENLYATDEERQLFFISDAPHAIKTCRNGLSNSFCNSKARKLWKNGEEISWKIIMRLYYKKLREKGQFKHLPKLTYSHVFLNSYSRMRVNLATQVLSETVASAIEILFAKELPKYKETVKFIRTFNKYFDLCNVKSLNDASRTLNEDKKPYTSIDDQRLKWLEYDFIEYLNDWERDVRARPGDFSKSERDKMLLSRETIEGLKMTAFSTAKIVRFLLNKGASFVLTQHLNQDPLEQSFGRHRSACGRNTNPSVWLYEANIDKLKSLKGVILEAVGGNTK